MTKVPVAPVNGSLPSPSPASRQAIVQPLPLSLLVIGVVIHDDRTVTDEAPRAEEETGCSAVTGNPHNRMEHK